jgi:hypothetical protein
MGGKRVPRGWRRPAGAHKLGFGIRCPEIRVASLPESGMITSRWPGCRAFAGAGRLAAPSKLVVFHAPVGYRRSTLRSAFFMPVG